MNHKGLVIAGAVVILAVATTLAIAVWPSSGPSSGGPFGPSGPTTENECISIPGRVITYGFETVKNGGSYDATIQHIGYVNPHNLKVLQTFTIPVHNNLSYAGLWGYPPEWMLAERTSVIRHSHEYELVIVTRLTGPEGHADAVLVNYTENGTRYLLRTITSLDLRQQPGPFPKCPP